MDTIGSVSPPSEQRPTRKRRLTSASSDGQPQSSKRPTQFDADAAPPDEAVVLAANGYPNSTETLIGSLSDEMLLEIFSHLDSVSLDAISATSYRMRVVAEDERLWRTFDFGGKSMRGSELLQRFYHLHEKTHKFRVRGCGDSYPAPGYDNITLTKHMLARLAQLCPEVREMRLDWAYLDTSEPVSIFNFPATLEKLVMRHVETQSPQLTRTFFTRIDTHMSHLHTIRFEYCTWFHTHNLIVFSKLENLRYLSLRGCRTMRDCVPYGSVSTRFGFRRLETLDLRETPVADSDIQCFNITSSLRHLYLRSPAEDPVAKETTFICDPLERFNLSSKFRGATDPDMTRAVTIEAPPEVTLSLLSSISSVKVYPEAAYVASRRTSSSTSRVPPQASGPSSSASSSAVSAKASTSTQSTSSLAVSARASTGSTSASSSAVSTNASTSSPSASSSAAMAKSSTSSPSASSSKASPNTSTMATARASTSSSSSSSSVSTVSPQASTSASATVSSRITRSSAQLSRDRQMSLVVSGEQHAASSSSASNSSTISPQASTSAASTTVSPRVTRSSAQQPCDRMLHQMNVVVSGDQNAAVQDAYGGGLQQQVIIVRGLGDGVNGIVPNGLQWQVVPSHNNNNSGMQQPWRQHLPSNVYRMGMGNGLPMMVGMIRDPTGLISDRGICSFGESRTNRRGNLVWIRYEMRPTETSLERLIVRGYRGITDTTLQHLAECAPRLRMLDVRNTGVTLDGLRTFRRDRPQCAVVTDHASMSAPASILDDEMCDSE